MPSFCKLNRRDVLKTGLAATVWGATRSGRVLANANLSVLWVQVFANGGWDQMLFCDPKLGPRADGGFHNLSQLRTVASIPYVDAYTESQPAIRPVDAFFQSFGDRLLVINGLDTTTNNHDVGTRYCMSGSLREGFPIFAAQVAGACGPARVMPLVDISGYDECGGLVAPVRLDYVGVPKIESLQDVNAPPDSEWTGETFTSSGDRIMDVTPRQRLHAAASARLARIKARQHLPLHQRGIEAWERARAAVPGLADLTLPNISSNNIENFKALATMGIRAFKAGLATTLTVSAGGPNLDSHGIADYDHLAELAYVFDVAGHIHDTAQAEGVPCVVVMSSDFGRTPVREPPGSGHWPVASMMILQNPAAAALNLIPGGKVIGGTTGAPEGPNDETVLQARRINPSTHAFDDAGTMISPAHVFRALRRVAGIADHAVLRPYPIAVEGGELELV